MEIRRTRPSDLEAVLALYAAARERMRAGGNPNQWGDSKPRRQAVEEDIRTGKGYVVVDGEHICGTFALLLEEEPTYRIITQGSWKDSGPYGTIHRLAGDGRTRGVFRCCLDFCRTQVPRLRADTHQDNHIMQHLLEKYGFERRGIINLEDGSPRIAYEDREGDGG